MRLIKTIAAVVLVVVSCIVLWVQWGTAKANKLVDQGNAALDEGNALAAQVGPMFAELFSETNLKGFPGNRADLAGKAKEVLDLTSRSAERFRAAAAIFQRAATEPADKTVVQYWTLKVQVLAKLADAKDVYAQIPKLIDDPSVTDADQLIKRMNALEDEADKLNKESAEADAAARKLHDEHLDKFSG